MAGPKTPYGYDPMFHDILARITVEQPNSITIQSGKHPHHLRAQFNQYRASWLNQAQVHHKRKELEDEKRCKENYYRLMQYECKLTTLGIVLQARGSTPVTITSEGRATLRGLHAAGIGIVDDPFDARDLDGEIRSILNSAPVMPDNPPQNTSSNKYGIPLGPPDEK
jgi:hypothetical protein